jgi:hypothetical protein
MLNPRQGLEHDVGLHDGFWVRYASVTSPSSFSPLKILCPAKWKLRAGGFCDGSMCSSCSVEGSASGAVPGPATIVFAHVWPEQEAHRSQLYLVRCVATVRLWLPIDADDVKSTWF